jgi:phosphoserine phosphatase
MTDADVLDLDSTLIRRGVKASTFSEMAEFAETVERRPLDKLLRELPALAALSEMKFSLARQVIRRRARYLGDLHRERLRVLAEEIASDAPALIASRIREVFA